MPPPASKKKPPGHPFPLFMRWRFVSLGINSNINNHESLWQLITKCTIAHDRAGRVASYGNSGLPVFSCDVTVERYDHVTHSSSSSLIDREMKRVTVSSGWRVSFLSSHIID